MTEVTSDSESHAEGAQTFHNVDEKRTGHNKEQGAGNDNEKHHDHEDDDERDLEAADGYDADDDDPLCQAQESETVLLKREPAPPKPSYFERLRQRCATFLQPRVTKVKASLTSGWKRFTESENVKAVWSVVSALLVLALFVAIFFGSIWLLVVIINFLFGDKPMPYYPQAYNDSRPPDPASHWPTDYTANIFPVHCHSHNDYWRAVPLITAIGAGCTGVEADVWQIDKDLYVGHSLASLTPKRTFRSLYVDPIKKILDGQNPKDYLHHKIPNGRKNGIFDTDPEETLILLVDFKPTLNGGDPWRYVTEQLEPLRKEGYLSYFDGEKVIQGPVTVVATGEAPFHKIIADTKYRDIFYDAPLEALSAIVSGQDFSGNASTYVPPPPARYDATKELAYLASITPKQMESNSILPPSDATIYTVYNSYYASTSFYDQIGIPVPSLRDSQRQEIRRQLAGAHAQGLKARYWETPGWPKALRNYIWRELLKEGADFLNVDDVWEAAREDWGWRQKGVWS